LLDDISFSNIFEADTECFCRVRGAGNMKSGIGSSLILCLLFTYSLTAAVTEQGPAGNFQNSPDNEFFELSVSGSTVSNRGDGSMTTSGSSGNQAFQSTRAEQVGGLHIVAGMIYTALLESGFGLEDVFVNTISDILDFQNFISDSIEPVPLDPKSSVSGGETVQSEPYIRIFPHPFRHVTRMEPSIPSGVPDGNLNIYYLGGRMVQTLSDPGESSCYNWRGDPGSSVPPSTYDPVLGIASLTATGNEIFLD
jgi:hypothetical protein